MTGHRPTRKTSKECWRESSNSSTGSCARTARFAGSRRKAFRSATTPARLYASQASPRTSPSASETRRRCGKARNASPVRSSLRPSAWLWYRPTAGGSKSTGHSAIWSVIPKPSCSPAPSRDLTHPEDLEADLENVRRLIAGEIRSYQMEKRYVHARGHLVTVLLNVSLVRDGQGQPLYFIAQIQDITERKQAEEEIEIQERRFSRLSRKRALDAILVVGTRVANQLLQDQQFIDLWRLSPQTSWRS